MVFESGIAHPRHRVLFLQPLGQFKRVLCMAFDAQRQGFEALKQHETIEGGLRLSEIPQPFHAGADRKGDVSERTFIAEHFPEIQPMVAWSWIGEQREFAVAVVEVASVDHHSANRRSVTADPFRGRFDDDVRAPFDGFRDGAACTERVVHDQRNAVFFCQSGESVEIRHVVTWIPDRFHIDAFRVLIDGRFVRRDAVFFHEFHVDAQTWQGHFELVVGSAIQEAGGHDVVSGLRDGGDGQELSRLTGGCGHSGGSAFEGCDAFLEHIRRRVHDPGVDISEILQREQRGGMLGVVEHIGCGLIDGHGTRIGRWVRRLTCMKLQGFEFVLTLFSVLRHVDFPN